MLGNCWVTEQLIAFQEGLSSMELVGTELPSASVVLLQNNTLLLLLLKQSISIATSYANTAKDRFWNNGYAFWSKHLSKSSVFTHFLKDTSSSFCSFRHAVTETRPPRCPYQCELWPARNFCTQSVYNLAANRNNSRDGVSFRVVNNKVLKPRHY
jgi:hypothetical protein